MQLAIKYIHYTKKCKVWEYHNNKYILVIEITSVNFITTLLLLLLLLIVSKIKLYRSKIQLNSNMKWNIINKKVLHSHTCIEKA